MYRTATVRTNRTLRYRSHRAVADPQRSSECSAAKDGFESMADLAASNLDGCFGLE